MDGSPRMISVRTGQHAGYWPSTSDYGLSTPQASQRTLRAAISCVGTGLHSGRKVNLTLHPAPTGAGIVFRRTDLARSAPAGQPDDRDIPAIFDHVADTRLCTLLASPARPDLRVGTVEHLLAALSGLGISNVLITLDGPEVPILDGSAACFTFLIECAGVHEQAAPASAIEITRVVRVSEGDAFAELRPGGPGLDMTMTIDFEARAIGVQSLSVPLSPQAFSGILARARTFTLASDVAAMRDAGLALGGSLDNAVVVDGTRVLNPGGLRMEDEFVRHKLLDAVGDLALAATTLHGRFVGHKSGHALNNRLLHALFADDANWSPLPASIGMNTGSPMAGWQDRHMQAAAAPI
jgi:UDP-3-O-[3-hydroxymyristoyl] N-acetylglucosamine deacetylase